MAHSKKRQMERSDIPFFTARADSDALMVESGEWIEGSFLEASRGTPEDRRGVTLRLCG